MVKNGKSHVSMKMLFLCIKKLIYIKNICEFNALCVNSINDKEMVISSNRPWYRRKRHD